jgi:hypothetical protein
MGADDVVKEVEDQLPGVRFRVEKWERLRKSGYITLRCEVNDPALFEACVEKLNGLKLFTGDLVEEVLGAMGNALTDKESELQAKEEETQRLREEMGIKDAWIEKVRGNLHKLGLELGIEDA